MWRRSWIVIRSRLGTPGAVLNHDRDDAETSPRRARPSRHPGTPDTALTLSSVAPPTNSIGWAAADAFICLIREPGTPPSHQSISVDLLIMETTDFHAVE